MIVLGKDKTLDNYFIDENGVITDQFGNVQELKIYQGRAHFKLVAVYKIQMWTNYGWRDTKIWAIHHLDENPLNNSLSNLIYLTHNQHTVLHKKGKHWTLSEETRKKLSDTRKGKNTWTKGLHWFNDGQKNYRCRECPLGCVKGRLKISEDYKGNHWNLSEETKRKMSESKKETLWITNGIKTIRIQKDDLQKYLELGYKKGRKKE